MQKIKVNKLYSYQTLVYKRGYNTFKKKEYLDYSTEIVNQLDKLDLKDCDTPIIVDIGLYFKIPKSYKQDKRNALYGKYAHNKNIDVDNVAKALIDVIAKHYQFNDKNVCKLSISKYWSSEDQEYFTIDIRKDTFN